MNKITATMRDRVKDLRRVRAADIAGAPWNWRRHPEAQRKALAGSIEELGFFDPLDTRELPDGQLQLIDGHARRDLLHESIGPDTLIPCIVTDFTEAEARKANLLKDPLAAMAEADTAALASLLASVSSDNEAVAAMLAQLVEANPVVEPLPEPGGDEDGATELDEDVEEDDLDLLFKSPYPWFGGKARVAGMVWKRFGDVHSYLEPFFGSGAVFLNRPQPFVGNETINDFDGFICNFWRAVQHDPDAVAKFADWPVNESDLHARHVWLLGRKDALAPQLEGDPDWHDAKVAGWWCWGMACWIGSGFCKGDGPWQVVENEDGSRQLVHLGDAGQGVNRQLVHLGSAGQGVNRQRVHLGDAGRGVIRQLVQLGNAGRGVNRKLVQLGPAREPLRDLPDGEEGQAGRGERGLLEWIRALSERLRRVRVCCGDWTRICGGRSGDAISHFFSTGEPVGIFLDPPYKLSLGDDANRVACYNSDGSDTDDVAEAVRQWCMARGDDPRLRIALCGYEGEHVMPASWECVKWKAHGGMAGLSSDPGSASKVNRFRERLWFSPHCLRPAEAEGLPVEKSKD